MTQELPLEDKVPAPTSKHPGGDGRADRPRSSQPVSPSGLLTTCPLLVLRSAPTPTSSLQTPASASSMTTTGMMASRGFSGVPVEADVSPSTGFPRSTAGTRTARGSSSHLGCLNPHPRDAFPLKHCTVLCDGQAFLLTAAGPCPLHCLSSIFTVVPGPC